LGKFFGSDFGMGSGRMAAEIADEKVFSITRRTRRTRRQPCGARVPGRRVWRQGVKSVRQSWRKLGKAAIHRLIANIGSRRSRCRIKFNR
jgi:hypothetical protein